MGFIAGLLILFTAGGGISYAAEGSLPGDTLYPVKVHVNEKVQSALALSDESEARLQTRLVERRLHEAESLAENNELNEERKDALELRINEHGEIFEKHAHDLEVSGKSDVALGVRERLSNALLAHQDILTFIDERANAGQISTGQAALLRAHVNHSIEIIKAHNPQVSATSTLSGSLHTASSSSNWSEGVAREYRKNADAALIALASVRKHSDLSDDLTVYIRNESEAARAAFDRGEAHLLNKQYKDAALEYHNADRIATRARVRISAALHLGPVSFSTHTELRDVEDREIDHTSSTEQSDMHNDSKSKHLEDEHGDDTHEETDESHMMSSDETAEIHTSGKVDVVDDDIEVEIDTHGSLDL